MEKPAITAPASGPTITPERVVRSLRYYDEATVDAIVDCYLGGASGPMIAVEFGIPTSTVFYQLDRRGIERRPSAVPWKHPAPSPRPCPTCDEKFRPTGYQVAHGQGKFCSRACARIASRVAEPEERTCARKGCGQTFTPMPSEAVRPGRGRYCSYQCRGLDFWQTGKASGLVMSLKERGLFKARAGRKWGPTWGGHTPAKGDGRRGAPRKYDLKDENGDVIRKRSREDVLAEVRTICAANPKLGLRPVAVRADLTKSQLEYLLREAGLSLADLRQLVS